MRFGWRGAVPPCNHGSAGGKSAGTLVAARKHSGAGWPTCHVCDWPNVAAMMSLPAGTNGQGRRQDRRFIPPPTRPNRAATNYGNDAKDADDVQPPQTARKTTRNAAEGTTTCKGCRSGGRERNGGTRRWTTRDPPFGQLCWTLLVIKVCTAPREPRVHMPRVPP